MHVYVCMYMYVCICMCDVCVYMYVCMYVCMCMCVYAYMCMYVCITYWGGIVRGKCPTPKTGGGIVRGVIVRGNCPRGNCPGGNVLHPQNNAALFSLGLLLSSLWVSRTGSASDWCALQEALYKRIDTIQYNVDFLTLVTKAKIRPF